MTTSTPRSALSALPVAIDGPRHLVDQVGSWVEARLGWQVTTGDALPPRLRLVGLGGGAGAGTSRSPGRSDRLPAIALVGPDDDPVLATRLAREVDAVVAWPSEHDRLARAAADLLQADPRVEVEGLRVVGSAGGVGTTTVALALGAVGAWAGRACLVVGRGDVPVPGVRTVAPEVLGGHRAWAAAVEVPGVAGLRAVRTAGPVDGVSPPAGVRVVVDGGAEGPGDVLVVRRDRPGLAAIGRSGAGAVVVVDTGPRGLREVRTAATGRALAVVPHTSRVPRLHDARRLPGSLPGSVFAPLRELGLVEFG